LNQLDCDDNVFLLCLFLQQVKWADGKKFEDKFVETLKKYGYKGSYMSKEWLNQPCFIQSFAPTSLTYISNVTDLPKVFLIDDVTILTEDTNQVFSPLILEILLTSIICFSFPSSVLIE
jgi:glycerophosphoryl diester phosphodiesterase